MTKKSISFKRGKYGGGANWGAGWDDLFKEYWDDLDQIVEDNFRNQHTPQIINKVFNGMEQILKHKVTLRINKYCEVTGEDDVDWLREVENILGYFKDAKTLSDKVIAITSAEQFLRATQPESREIKKILGENNG